ncbi:MAG: protease Do [Armatimonadetes bacterium]|nr:protease Do [Armatimonadota bacterium]
MKNASVVVAASLAAGVGLGVGQGLVGTGSSVWAQAAAIARSMEEQTVISVSKQVRPAVVSISREGGSGTGVVIRREGVILTNAHVVGNLKQVDVQLADGRKFKGEVVGVDPTVDIAVVKVAANDLPEAPIADSDRLEVGQTAIAIGNPLGLKGTVTTGVVSATNRQRSADDFVGFVQTDAAINPGNSGGPLLDSQGRVIGINTWIIGRASGLGFAVPINVAKEVAQQVLDKGGIHRAVLGIIPNSVTPEVAAKLKLSVEEGAVVAEVSADSPSEKAGLKVGDVVVALDGEKVRGAGDLRRVLRNHKAGDVVAVSIRRGEESRTIKVQLTEASDR